MPASIPERRALRPVRVIAYGSMRLASLLLCGLVLACVEPADRRPGTWLSGELVEQPVADWSFTADHPEIMLETRTWYGVPHSVTIVCASRDGRLFVGARDPDGKRWVANVDRDPDVRLKIGGRVYERRLKPIEDPEQQERVRSAYAAKYAWPESDPSERPAFRYFEVVERS
jgi:hypothetical protein